MTTSVACREQLEDFQAATIAKENVYPNRRGLAITKRRVFTEEEKREIMHNISLKNLELTVYDFIIFNTLQDLFFPVKEMMEKAGIFKHKFKMLHNRAKDDIDKMNIACRISETHEFMAVCCGYLDSYRNDYMKEGGMFFNMINYEFHKLVAQDMTKLHYSIRMALINTNKVKEEYVEFAVQIWKLRCVCCMMQDVFDCIKEQIRDMVGYDVSGAIKDVQLFRFKSFNNTLTQLAEMVSPSFSSLPQMQRKTIELATEIIIKKLLGVKMADNIMNALVATINDYGNYCVARMLIDVRGGGHIEDRVKNELVEHFDYTPAMLEQMEKEMRKTRINISSGDAMEIKDYVPMMKGAITKGVFIQKMCVEMENDCEMKKESWNR